MSFSIAERDYIYKLLSAKTPVRPDGRKPTQLRAIDACVNFLPNSNGSSRIRLSDGSEVIISVKSKVVKLSKQNHSSKRNLAELIDVELVIDNLRDDFVSILNIENVLKTTIVQNFNKFDNLKLTTKYYFKLFIDVLYLTGNSNEARVKNDMFLTNPLSLISFGVYLALKSTRLPLLISNVDDQEIEELPTFNDDWSSSTLLYENGNDTPPLIFLVAVVNNNLLVDPTIEEQEVADSGLIVAWHSGKVVTPIESINLNQSGNTEYYKGLYSENVIDSVALIESIGGVVAKSLDEIVEDVSENEFLDSIF